MIVQAPPGSWREVHLSDVVVLQRGHDLPAITRGTGRVPVIGSFGVTGFHDVPRYDGPGVAIGRSGASIGTATYVEEAYWPLNTCLFVRDFRGNDPRWVYRLLDGLDFLAFNSGSAQPSLNRNFLQGIPVSRPPIAEQRAIAEVLGALDDKIAANHRLSSTSASLASVLYDQGVADIQAAPMSSVLDPVLGGTPSRARSPYWGGDNPWASAKDIASADHGVVCVTLETITDAAIAETKTKPLPEDSVILTARGTVGTVARLAVPSSFNQSCYGFTPGRLPAGVLYFAVLRATERAKEIAHGSVFDTITTRTFDHLLVPDPSDPGIRELEEHVKPLLDLVSTAVHESRSLSAIRDALLPQLMSGRIRVRDAERVVGEVV